MKITEQQERFCQLVVAGRNQTQAYREAGYKGRGKQLGDNASRLIANERIQARIAELRAAAAQQAQIDLTWLIRESVDTYTAARKDAAYAAAVSALKTIGVYTGLWDEKSTRHNINRNVDEYSDDDLLAHIQGGSGAGAFEPAPGKAQPH